METAHRLPRFFVLWSTLAWVFPITLSTLSIGLLLPASGLVARMLMANALGVAGRLVGVTLHGMLLRPVRHQVSVGEWIGLSCLGVFAGSLAAYFAGHVVGVVQAVIVLSMAWDISEAVELAISVLVRGAVSGVVFGAFLGVIQGDVLARSGFRMAFRTWIPVSIGAWLLYEVAKSLGFFFVREGSGLGPVGSSAVLAMFIPGLVTGIALKRIVEGTPPDAPVEGGTIPEVPEAAPSV